MIFRCLLFASALGSVAVAAGAKPAAETRCPMTNIMLGRAVETLKPYRTFKGPDGESHLEIGSIPGTTKSFYGGSTVLTQFDLGHPSHAVLVYGHPNMEIRKHPSPYREVFIILSGSSIMEFPNGQRQVLKPGDMVVVEDQGTPGRSGHAGPCGYVALDLQFQDSPANATRASANN